jgi:hypothetical protein
MKEERGVIRRRSVEAAPLPYLNLPLLITNSSSLINTITHY